MRLRAIAPFIIIVVAVAILTIPSVAGSYTMTIMPTSTVSLGTTVNVVLSITGGTRNSPYTILFQVVKPNGDGSALTSRNTTTDSKGSATISLSYPDPSWTASSGTVATDVGGVYNVFANQTAPTNSGLVASGQFTVSSQLTVVVSQPVSGTVVQRGNPVSLSVSVSSISGPDTLATVWANNPSGGKIFLPQTGGGVYTYNYLISTTDPIGEWTIVAQATDSQGNSGTSPPVNVTITKNNLVVNSLTTYNSKGTPTTSFSPGDSVFAFFRVQYASGPYLTTGEYTVDVKNPSGFTVANLTAAYDSSLFGFYTTAGYSLSTTDPSGTWTVAIGANSVSDGNGNTGPAITTSTTLQVVTSPLSYWPFVLAGVIAIVGAVATAKRFDTTLEGFHHMEQLIGGPLPRGASLLLSGDAGSGKTILAYQLLHDELESGKLCALLSYDAFPEDVQARMNEFGWDIVSPLRKGRLKIIDCYSSLAGQGEGAIKDPSDLTELNIQVTAFIGKAKGGPVTVVLDSLTPIFNGVEEKQAINFIQTIAAKVKKTGGLFIQTASKGAVSDDAAAKIKTMADGVIELSAVRVRGRVHRFLSVVKMERRQIASGSVPFEIDRTRGFVFRVSRFSLLRKRLGDFLKAHHNLGLGKHHAKKSDGPPSKMQPSRLRQ